MEPGQTETVNFDDLHAPIIRVEATEPYLVLEPPDAVPRLVVQKDMESEQIIAFVTERLGIIREMRADMLKRFEKSPSLRCHYQTGDVVCLLGRPFMLRVFPLPSGKQVKGGMHGRVNINTKMHNDLSLLDLYVMQTGNHDQTRTAFEAFARPVFENNARMLIRQCCQQTGLSENLAAKVHVRPMRSGWVRIDRAKGSVWVSEDLLPFPPKCTVYAFLREAAAIKLGADASDEERAAFIAAALPEWESMKATLEDPDSVFRHQLPQRS